MKFCCVGQRRRWRRRRRRRCGRLRRLRVRAPLPCRATRRAQTESSESERGRERDSREELYELFVLQLVFVRRVASALSKAAQSLHPAPPPQPLIACWLCSGVGVCVWRLLSFGTCRMFCCCCETFYMPALFLSPSLLRYSTESMEDKQRRILCKL